MNLFDNANWLKISELKQLDDELLNYIDYIYNEFLELHYTDDEWIYIIKREENYNNKRIIDFANKYLNRYVHEYIDKNNIIMYIFIKYDTNRLKNIIKKLSVNQIIDILTSINFLDIIFTMNDNVKFNKYLHSFSLNYKQLYYSYIYIRIILPLYSVIIPYLLSKYLLSYKTYVNQNVNIFLMDFHDRQVMSNVNNVSFDELYLLKVINKEYIQKMQPYVDSLYDCYIKEFMVNPNFKLLNIILEYNIKSIDNKNALKIIDFVKNEKGLLNEVIEKIILSCKLTNKQINELKAYQLLNNI